MDERIFGGNIAGGLVVPSGRVVYDGKRMRKAITRRTIDHCASIMRWIEDRALGGGRSLRLRPYASLQPNPANIINLLPPLAYSENPVNAVTTKFVHLSLNKQRCPVNAVRWTPDGRRLLTGTSTGEFTMWNAMTFNFETILQAHETAIRAMCWSHNGNFLVTGDHSGTIKIWQPSMNNLKIISGSHQEPVRQVTFSPNDAKFASCSDDGTVKIWDFEEMLEERCLTGHGWDVRTIHWHPFRAILASGSKDNLVKLWDPKSGSNFATIHGHKNNVLDVKWNRNGNWLVTASKDQVVKLFDIRTLKELQTYRSHKKEVNAVVWHPIHESLFASAGAEGAIYFHIDSQEEPVGSLEGAHDAIVWTVDWHPLGHVLASGSADCSTRFWTRHRPGDPGQDKYILGKTAAEALGLLDNPNQMASSQMATEEEGGGEEHMSLPGLGSGIDKRLPSLTGGPAHLAKRPPPPSSAPSSFPSHHHPSSSIPPGVPPPPPGWRPGMPLPPIPPGFRPPPPHHAIPGMREDFRHDRRRDSTRPHLDPRSMASQTFPPHDYHPERPPSQYHQPMSPMPRYNREDEGYYHRERPVSNASHYDRSRPPSTSMMPPYPIPPEHHHHHHPYGQSPPPLIPSHEQSQSHPHPHHRRRDDRRPHSHQHQRPPPPPPSADSHYTQQSHHYNRR